MEFLGESLIRNAEEFPDRIAVIQEKSSLTYKELNRESSRLANALKKTGVKRGDRVALLMKGGREWLLSLYACQKLGVGVVLVHLRLLPQEILRMIELADAGTLIYSEEYSDKAAYIASHSDAAQRRIRLGDPAKATAAGEYPFEELLRSGDTAEAQIPLDGSEDSVLLFTSGTTSAAKGMVRTQKMMRVYSSLLADAASRRRCDIMLTPSPLFHAAGLCCVVKTLVNAGTLILLDRFDCEKICRQIQRYKVTQIALVPPTSYQRLRNSGYPDQFDLSSVRLAHVAAGKASRECFEDLFAMFPKAAVRLSWGSTEASNITCAVFGQETLLNNPQRLMSVGRVNPVSELKLIAEDGSVVEGAGKGEAYVRSPLVFDGYLKAPELTERSFSDGWFKTEDILCRDAEGYCYLLDRKRDIIKTGGENVYAQEVEQDILANPAISECAVVGIPDRQFGEAVAAAVVFKKDCSLTADEFIGFCRRVMPSFKKPKYWAVMDALPKNDVGKVQKIKLKSQAGKLFTAIS